MAHSHSFDDAFDKTASRVAAQLLHRRHTHHSASPHHHHHKTAVDGSSKPAFICGPSSAVTARGPLTAVLSMDESDGHPDSSLMEEQLHSLPPMFTSTGGNN